jgi:HEAT repeat protein
VFPAQLTLMYSIGATTMSLTKGWMLFLGALLLLVVALVGYKYWRRAQLHSQLATALHDPDPVVRMGAVRKLGRDGPSNLLIEALKDEDPDIRYVAVGSLGWGGLDNAEKVRHLLEVFKDDKAWVRKHGLEILRRLPAEFRPFIYKGVEDEDPRVRAGAAYVLARYPPKGMDQPPPLPVGEEKTIAQLVIPLIRDENLEVRKAVYYCLFS